MELKIYPEARALIFDLDGTLSDSLPVHIASWHAVCSKLNCTFDERILVEMTGAPTISFAERIKKEQNLAIDPEELVVMKQKEFWKTSTRLNRTMRWLIWWKKHTVESRWPLVPVQAVQVPCYNWKNWNWSLFDYIVTADDVTKHNQNLKTFLKCAELMGIEPRFCQVFEDGELGMQAAISAGMLLTDVRPFVTDPFN